MLTAASVHESQVDVPLAIATAGRVIDLYALMNSFYVKVIIKQYGRDLDHVTIIDPHSRKTADRRKKPSDEAKRIRVLGHWMTEYVRHGERLAAG